jgi:hypothetical protein
MVMVNRLLKLYKPSLSSGEMCRHRVVTDWACMGGSLAGRRGWGALRAPEWAHRLAQGDRIIDAVPDETHLFPLRLQILDTLGLLFRQRVGEVAVHAKPMGQCCRWRILVTGEDVHR